MIYVFEVGYTREKFNLSPCIKEVVAKDANEGKKIIKKEIPKGMGIRQITLIGSKKSHIDK